LSPARVGNGAGRGRFGLVRGCPLGTGQDRCEWHASGTASEDDVRGSLAEWPSARPQGEARLRRACLVGKGRRPAAGVTWDSNPLRPCPNNRGSGHEGVVTCPFLVLVVTARARQGSPDDQGGTDPKRTRDRGSAPGGRPGSPGLPRCRVPRCCPVGLWWPLVPTSGRYPRRAWLGAPAGLPRTRAVTSREYVHHLLADGAQSGPAGRAGRRPFGRLRDGWRAAAPSELDAPLLEQSNWVAYRLRPSWGPKTQNA
jgi:hypothetical protein